MFSGLIAKVADYFATSVDAGKRRRFCWAALPDTLDALAINEEAHRRSDIGLGRTNDLTTSIDPLWLRRLELVDRYEVPASEDKPVPPQGILINADDLTANVDPGSFGARGVGHVERLVDAVGQEEAVREASADRRRRFPHDY